MLVSKPSSRGMALNRSIPLIDFQKFLSGSKDDRKEVASEFDQALSSAGFIYLKHHGIKQDVIESAFGWSKRFFALPISTKLATDLTRQPNRYGYSGVGTEKVRNQPCWKESFDCCFPKADRQPNNWPSELPGFPSLMQEFYEACSELRDQLLDCLSLALNLPTQDSLDRYHTKSDAILSLMHYPAVLSGDVVRNPAHSDFGTLTLLFQENVGGLEIADMSSIVDPKTTSAETEKTASFIHIDPEPGTVVVNAGYLLKRWSNGRWKDTVHRVSEPPSRIDGGMVPERYSIGFFSHPDTETVVDALPGCWGPDNPKKWKPLNVGKFIDRKRSAIYS